ncbi:zinc finger MYM-type protein 1-like [Aphis craccivora]|uniref:Zinc finger MYM-type protein 1-like n=1 Tax=Aphis craccivora TaxID=307492 RepID=A0A6G0YDV9_APHCR|nr:zinc finger MYM-type protein 1-like [Aphis craccivora]
MRRENLEPRRCINNYKNVERKANKHDISERNLVCQEQFKLLGENIIDISISESRRLAAIKHNEKIGISHRILTRLIHVVCCLGNKSWLSGDMMNEKAH